MTENGDKWRVLVGEKWFNLNSINCWEVVDNFLKKYYAAWVWFTMMIMMMRVIMMMTKTTGDIVCVWCFFSLFLASVRGKTLSVLRARQPWVLRLFVNNDLKSLWTESNVILVLCAWRKWGQHEKLIQGTVRVFQVPAAVSLKLLHLLGRHALLTGSRLAVRTALLPRKLASPSRIHCVRPRFKLGISIIQYRWFATWSQS